MKFQTLMVIKAAFALILGLILVSAPNLILNITGIPSAPGAIIFGRIYGGVCLGIFCLCWFARNIENGMARNAITLDLWVYDAIALVIVLQAELTGGANVIGWFYVAMYLFFTIAFGYFLLAQKQASMATR